MVGIACGLAVYTPVRHTLGSADIALDTRYRDHGDDLGHNDRVLKKALNYHGGECRCWVCCVCVFSALLNCRRVLCLIPNTHTGTRPPQKKTSKTTKASWEPSATSRLTAPT